MNGIPLIAFAVLVITFFGVIGYNAIPGNVAVTYSPPYYFAKGDWVSYANSFAFVLIFSMLFFGLGAPAAMAVEGLKYGVLFSAGVLPISDLLFLIPEILAMLAACTLGEGVINDWSGKGIIYNYWSEGTRYLLFGIAALAALILLFHDPFITGALW